MLIKLTGFVRLHEIFFLKLKVVRQCLCVLVGMFVDSVCVIIIQLCV